MQYSLFLHVSVNRKSIVSLCVWFILLRIQSEFFITKLRKIVSDGEV